MLIRKELIPCVTAFLFPPNIIFQCYESYIANFFTFMLLKKFLFAGNLPIYFILPLPEFHY